MVARLRFIPDEEQEDELEVGSKGLEFASAVETLTGVRGGKRGAAGSKLGEEDAREYSSDREEEVE